MKLMQKNRLLYIEDNLRVMRGMNSDSVDLIATDPPFDTKKIHNAPMGSRAAGQQFDDRWRWDEVTDEWHDLIATRHPAIKEIIEAAVIIEGGSVDLRTGKVDTGRIKNSIAAYLTWMAPRIAEMQRILKPTGILYLHCNQFASHYLKLLMDAIFGRGNFVNEIIWNYGTPSGGRVSGKKPVKVHDTLLVYARKYGKHLYVPQFTPYSDKYVRNWFRHEDEDGRAYRTRSRKGKIVRQYLDESLGMPLSTVWSDIMQLSSRRGWFPTTQGEETGWGTQKPLSLYQRIIKASSNPGDVVLDPFCGCATTCVAAEMEDRRWIGIDIDPVAENITKDRLYDISGLKQLAKQRDDDIFVMVKKNLPRRTDIPKVSDAEMRLALWKRQGKRCANPYCSLERVQRPEDMHLDHVIPKSRSGEDDILNRIGLCGNCNSRKSTKAWGAFLDEERAKQPHPTVTQ